jgi:DNA-binding response OmpR family regulator
MNILISDTDIDVVNEIGIIFQQLEPDYKLFIVNSGSTSLDFIEHHSIDIVFIGRTLMDMPGLELVKIICRLSNIPIIFLSPRKELDLMVLALNAGANKYISLPFNRKIFIATTKATLRRAKWDSCTEI